MKRRLVENGIFDSKNLELFSFLISMLGPGGIWGAAVIPRSFALARLQALSSCFGGWIRALEHPETKKRVVFFCTNIEITPVIVKKEALLLPRDPTAPSPERGRSRAN